MSSTMPLIDYYRAKGLLRVISADRDPEEVFARSLEVLAPSTVAAGWG